MRTVAGREWNSGFRSVPFGSAGKLLAMTVDAVAAALAELECLMQELQGGKTGRHLKLTSVDQIPRAAVRGWLGTSAAIARDKA